MVVETKSLARSYGDSPALIDISIAVPAGATVAVFGPNGSGKSTLLRLLATLLQPDSGSLRVFGKELPNESYAVRPKVGLLTHNSMLYRHLSPRENLTYLASIYGLGDERVEELLDIVGMTTRADDPLSDLSKGMIQRVALCRCLLHQPELLLLDEPFANLDPGGVTIAERLIGAQEGRTRILASHDIAHELTAADYVLGLKAGRQVFFGSAEEILHDQIQELYR